MNAKDLVRARFPQAEVVYRKPVFAVGQSSPYLEGGWAVLTAPELGARELGSGTTEEAAWSSAVAALSGQPREVRPTFKEWLAQQAERDGSAEQRQRLIDEWTRAVTDLHSQIIRWLADEDAHEVLLYETGTVRKEEEGLGSYEVSALRIELASRFVELIPIGRNIAGSLGGRGDLGLRPEGRVDMRNRTRRYMLYRVAAEGSKWVIMNDEDYAIADLTKETFVSALQELLS